MKLDRWLFLAGQQCPKRMYLQSRARPAGGHTFELVQRFSQEAREAARARWPEGVAVADGIPLAAAIAETRRLLEQDGPRAIFDAVFEHDGVVARIDVLERSRRMKWYLTAVKTGAHIHDRHVQDLALQVWVARANGVDLREASIAMVDRAYVREGVLDAQALFHTRDATQRVEAALARLPDRMSRSRQVLEQSAPPPIEVGSQCTDPYPCEYLEECGPKFEDDDIRLLPSLHGHRKRELLDAGILRVSDIPASFALNERQKRARQALMENRLVWSEHLREDLERLTCPLWCIDFEAVAPAVPRYPGCRPWQQIPFQWSAHRLDEDWGEPRHFGFLAEGAGDPRRAFAESLLQTVTGEGPVLVWSKPFEDTRLKELQADLPDLEEGLAGLRARLVDLLEIVRRHVYHPAFHGSFSIKSVLPALVQGLSYDGLAISKGDEASLAYDRLCRDDLGAEEAAALRRALEEYCLLDTLAVVRILQVLRRRATTRTAV